MFKSVIDSGWIEVGDLTALVGKNESGKTTILRALHKLNPFKPDPYSMEREWPRGFRKDRNPGQVVCTARFRLTDEERREIAVLTAQEASVAEVEVARDYSNRLEVVGPADVFPDRVHPNDIDQVCSSLALPVRGQVGDSFLKAAEQCLVEVKRFAHDGRYTDITTLRGPHTQALQAALSSANPHLTNEQQYVVTHVGRLQEVEQKLKASPSIRKKAHEYVAKSLPTFIYMSDYRTFRGAAQLDLVKTARDRKTLSEEDKTLLTILDLSAIDLDQEVVKGNATDPAQREQRQYDLDDASATLTRAISDRWRQRRYEVVFRGDGQFFYTFVKDERDPSLIRLEERSQGFQWFFSFDLMFMYESKGTFKGCVILLDEPGLHLHPNAQGDLLRRMEAYARDNTLIYATHLPFMLDLGQPNRIRVLSETDRGTIVTDDLTHSQPEGKFVVQTALGISGRTSYLVSPWNLVVEGVDDYWIVSELSNLLKRSGEAGLPEGVFVTPAGGASEAAYIATFMIGQDLNVAVLLDSDKAATTPTSGS